MRALSIFSEAKVYGVGVAAAALTYVVVALPPRQDKLFSGPIQERLHRPDNASVPRPEPQLIRGLTRDQAVAANAARPLALGSLQAALAFGSRDRLNAPGHEAAVDCLASAVYYEAGGESEAGQRAVAQVVLNRVRHPAFPQTVCGVVYQGSELSTGCQFTFTCDGSLARKPSPGGWDRARRIAEAALAGRVEPSVGMATHYHANWVVPYWTGSLDKIAVVGSHIFYRWKGYWGQRRAFNQAYAGEAPDVPRLAYAEYLLARWDAPPAQTDSPSTSKALSSSDRLYAEPRPPVADLATRRLVADDMSGRLVADDSATSALEAGSLRPSS